MSLFKLILTVLLVLNLALSIKMVKTGKYTGFSGTLDFIMIAMWALVMFDII